MAKGRKKATQQGALGVSHYTLLKKPLDHLGKQLDVPGSYWADNGRNG